MKAVLRTVGQIAMLFVVASALALTANEFRRGGPVPGREGERAPGNWIDIRRAYFAKTPGLTPPTGAEPNTAAAPPASDPFASLPFRVIDLPAVQEAVSSPDYDARLTILIDARNDQGFLAGRIPGALQLDYYRIDAYIERVMEYALSARQVIVYCNGGRCEDSILVCQELERRGVQAPAIALFKDGWEAWQAAKLPVETGPAQEQ